MQTTYRLNAKEISMAFLKSLKTQFAGQDVEIVVKTVEKKELPKPSEEAKARLLQTIRDSRETAPIISPDIDIRALIDQAHDRGGF